MIEPLASVSDAAPRSDIATEAAAPKSLARLALELSVPLAHPVELRSLVKLLRASILILKDLKN
jgi:hypothetical protein